MKYIPIYVVKKRADNGLGTVFQQATAKTSYDSSGDAIVAAYTASTEFSAAGLELAITTIMTVDEDGNVGIYQPNFSGLGQ